MSKSKWYFDKPEEMGPGEHVFALVVYTETQDVGVRSMSAADVVSAWGAHVFAWQPIEYPGFTIRDIATVVEDHSRALTKETTEVAERI